MSTFLERKYIFWFLFLLMLFVGGLILFTRETLSHEHCKGTPVVHIGGKVFTVTVADTDESRSTGLSRSSQLLPDSGMLFLFSSPNPQSFWMKDMAYPIDIIWIDASWHVAGIVSSALPESYPTPFVSPPNTQYVLEVNQWVARDLGVATGSLLQYDACN